MEFLEWMGTIKEEIILLPELVEQAATHKLVEQATTHEQAANPILIHTGDITKLGNQISTNNNQIHTTTKISNSELHIFVSYFKVRKMLTTKSSINTIIYIKTLNKNMQNTIMRKSNI